VPLSVIRLAGLVLVLTTAAGQPGLASAAIILTLAVLLTALLAAGVPTPPAAALAYGETLRRHARRTAFLPQCDPDAPGRPRPRAPAPA
jgi:hypothetical protein